MTSTPRLYLFCGSDSRASLMALHRWETVFLEKYGQVTRYVIEADELQLDQVRQQITSMMQSASLFPEPKLILIKRLDRHDKGRTAADTIRKLLEWVKQNVGSEDTIVIWCDTGLPEKSTIRNWFLEAQEGRRAKVTEYSVPTYQEVGRVAQKYLTSFHCQLEPVALQWLTAQYRILEKTQRLALRLKTTEVLLRDERIWWFYSLLDSASLLAEKGEITQEILEKCAEEVHAVSVFEISNAIRDHQWERARTLFNQWAEGRDQSDYFGFWSIMRLQYERLLDVRSEQGVAQASLQLLAEVELLSKNTQIPYDFLSFLLILRLEQADRGVIVPIIEPRRLWLSTLPLS